MKQAISFLILVIAPMICFSQKDYFDTIAVKQNWPEYANGSVIEINRTEVYVFPQAFPNALLYIYR